MRARRFRITNDAGGVIDRIGGNPCERAATRATSALNRAEGDSSMIVRRARCGATGTSRWLGSAISIPLAIYAASAVVCVFAVSLLVATAPVFAAAPTVESESFGEVSTTNATLHAVVNADGEPSTYVFEYGTREGSYEVRTLAAGFGTGTSAVGVVAQIEGLQPDTVYHFRVVVNNEAGTTSGADQHFRMFSLASRLPDERGYEMVTPPGRESVQFYPPQYPSVFGTSDEVSTDLVTTVAPDGQSLAFAGTPPLEGGNGSMGLGAGNQYLATRDSEGGWSEHSLQPLGYLSAVISAFSTDLDRSIVRSQEPLLAGLPAGDELLYVQNNSNGAEEPLITVAPPNRTPSEFQTIYAGASSDFSRFFFEANDALVSPAVDGGASQFNLYESHAGELRAVNVLPDGDGETNASFGSAPNGFDRAISSDGLRVFWTAEATNNLYVREDGTKTSLIAEGAEFLTASSDGSKVLYAKGGDLYEDDLTTGATSDLTPGGQLQGVLGASEDLAYIYFAVEAALAPGATAGKPNIYVWHGGATSFIATVAGNENVDATSIWAPDIGQRTSEVTPSGNALIFQSMESLTGYNNVAPTESRAEPEIYVYSAEEGTLFCVSCNQTGESPPIQTPGGIFSVSNNATYQPRLITEDGDEVFFDSRQPLLPEATNNQVNAYEWERDGHGDCSRAEGCMYLLSGGASEAGSYVIGTSESGANVFILTHAQLVPDDLNDFADVYDVRIGVKEAAASPRCSGAGCQGAPPASPVFATPASVTFSGVGNIVKHPVVKKASKKASAESKRALQRAIDRCRRLYGRHKKRLRGCERRARGGHSAKAAHVYTGRGELGRGK